MRTLLRTVSTVIAVQPFYTEEVQVIRLVLATISGRLRILERLRLA